MSQDVEGTLPERHAETPSEESVERRTALKRGLALVPLVVTVHSRPAWAGYASLEANYGAESQSG